MFFIILLQKLSCDPQTCRMVGKIENVCADESILDDKGKIDPKKLRPIVFDPVQMTYVSLGDVVAKSFQEGIKLR